jgi:hypothetical protein
MFGDVGGGVGGIGGIGGSAGGVALAPVAAGGGSSGATAGGSSIPAWLGIMLGDRTKKQPPQFRIDIGLPGSQTPYPGQTVIGGINPSGRPRDPESPGSQPPPPRPKLPFIFAQRSRIERPSAGAPTRRQAFPTRDPREAAREREDRLRGAIARRQLVRQDLMRAGAFPGPRGISQPRPDLEAEGSPARLAIRLGSVGRARVQRLEAQRSARAELARIADERRRRLRDLAAAEHARIAADILPGLSQRRRRLER